MRLQTEIPKGSLTAVVGPNGAGKSTLLKGVVGSLPPLSGQVSLGALESHDVSYLPQQSEVDRLFPISVYELVSMGLWRDIGAFGRVSHTHRARIKEALAAVGLENFEKRAIGSLSGGQLQRALFARLLLQDSPLVLLDEPFNAIDASTTADLINVVKHWHGEGRTILAANDRASVGFFVHTFYRIRVHAQGVARLCRCIYWCHPSRCVFDAASHEFNR